MGESVLLFIRQCIVGNCCDEHFDPALIAHINTVLSILKQLGVCEDKNFSVCGTNDTWEDFIGDGVDYDMIKTYMYLRVKMLFDPSASNTILTADRENIKELEWRIEEAANDRKRRAAIRTDY